MLASQELQVQLGWEVAGTHRYRTICCQYCCPEGLTNLLLPNLESAECPETIELITVTFRGCCFAIHDSLSLALRDLKSLTLLQRYRPLSTTPSLSEDILSFTNPTSQADLFPPTSGLHMCTIPTAWNALYVGTPSFWLLFSSSLLSSQPQSQTWHLSSILQSCTYLLN